MLTEPSMAFLSPLAACVLFSLCCICVADYHGKEGAVIGQREFDYFLLSLQWPGTICQHTTHCCASNGCCRSNATNLFTIHGLWANYNDGTWPACCKGTQFDVKQITPLLGELKSYWPTMSCGSTSTCHGTKGLFWAHEWEKHGTCSSPVFRNEYSYFLATINLYLKYNITDILVKEGYVPSNSEKYPLGGVVSAIQNTFRATPELVCSHGAVKELHLCFSKNFEPKDCLSNTGQSSCPGYISLPEYMTHSLGHITSIEGSSSNEVI